jgi:D-threo-aldose 1-dehydrogenase
MSPLDRRLLLRSGLEITSLGFGGGALGGMYEPVDEAGAEEAVRAAYDAGISYFDTAPLYGHGRSESRLGRALAGVPRGSYVLATKVGIMITPDETDPRYAERVYADPWVIHGAYDFSYDACLRSLEDSMRRLRVDRVDVVNIHDPDEGDSAMPVGQRRGVTHFPTVMDGAYRALHDLRSEGVIGAIGVGMNGVEPLLQFARAGDFDCFLLAGRYTLLEQNGLDEFLPVCAERDIGVVVGGVFNSGILATGPSARRVWHNYVAADEGVIQRVGVIEAVCARHGVPLPAAALQFPLAHPAVATVIPGMRSAAEVAANLAAATVPIPESLWQDLRDQGIIDFRAPIPEPNGTPR